MPGEPLRILLVDDHPLVRNGLRTLLTSLPDVVVAGEAANGEEAIVLATELKPDIILMDLHMPGLNGIEATRRIVQASPRIGILVLTMLEDDASVFAAMRAGARERGATYSKGQTRSRYSGPSAWWLMERPSLAHPSLRG